VTNRSNAPKRRYYIDESGNSGDLAAHKGDDAFGDQPVFVLACVGEPETDALKAVVEFLRRRHGIRATELKASKLAARPEVLVDAVSEVLRVGAPVFLEVMETRYCVATHLVEKLYARGHGPRRPPRTQARFVAFADRIATQAPEALSAYLRACRDLSGDQMAAVFNGLLRAFSDWEEPLDEAIFSATLALQVAALPVLAEPGGFETFLPARERGLNGKTLWINPGINAFIHIYARLNQFEGGDLTGVELVHDRQRYTETALNDAKAAVEEAAEAGRGLSTWIADFGFAPGAALSFADSHDTPGLQVADLLAGLAMRLARGIDRDGAVQAELQAAIVALIDATTPSRGPGVHLVATDRLAQAIIGPSRMLV
jgi:hypothetical protein